MGLVDGIGALSARARMELLSRYKRGRPANSQPKGALLLAPPSNYLGSWWGTSPFPLLLCTCKPAELRGSLFPAGRLASSLKTVCVRACKNALNTSVSGALSLAILGL